MNLIKDDIIENFFLTELKDYTTEKELKDISNYIYFDNIIELKQSIQQMKDVNDSFQIINKSNTYDEKKLSELMGYNNISPISFNLVDFLERKNFRESSSFYEYKKKR